MGPFTLLDLVGLDVSLAVTTSVYEQTFHDPRFAPNIRQRSLVDAGRLGRKSGEGFYDHSPSAIVPVPAILDDVSSAEKPISVGFAGDLGHASGLLDRLSAAGIAVEPVSAPVPGLVIGDTVLWPTDGRTATEVSVAVGNSGSHILALDLVRDWSTATHVAVAPADDINGRGIIDFGAVLQAAGLSVVLVGDGPAWC